MRTHYRNGDEIQLQHNGCDGCAPAMINGLLCHEHGCPEAWRDKEQDEPDFDPDPVTAEEFDSRGEHDPTL